MKLQLDRPLAVFDIESTGLNRRNDRIIDLAIMKIHPDGRRESFTFRVNPEMPIPAAATAVHGITDADVTGCPVFKDIAAEVASILAGCDLGGFNLLYYDIPMLEEEFTRAGVTFSSRQCRVIDVQRIFHIKEPRDLTAALAFYCGEEHTDAHGAMPDVEATVKVLEGQFEKYPDLPTSVRELADFCNPANPEWVDRQGKLAWDADGDAVVNFGQNAGKKLRELVAADPGFLNWMLKKDFPRDTQEIIRNALAGQFPVPPSA